MLAGLSSFIFLAGYWRYPHLIFPILIWATLRFRQPGAVTGSFLVTAIAIAGAVDGSIPLADRSDTEIVQILEGLLGGVAVSLLILGAVLEERERAVEQVAEAVAGFNEAQQVAHVGSWDWNIAEDKVSWSDELFRMFGLEPQSQDVTFESYVERVHPDDRDLVRETVARAYAEGEPFLFDQRIVLPDGGVRWTQSRGRVVTDDAGTPVRMVGTAEDVTERKRLDALRDTILTSVSHELRTPLTSILGFSLTLEAREAGLDAGRRREIIAHLVEPADGTVVRQREVDLLLALGGPGNRRDDDVDTLRQKRRDPARGRRAGVVDSVGIAERPSRELLRDLDVVAPVVAGRVLVAERRRVALDPDLPPTAAPNLGRQRRKLRLRRQAASCACSRDGAADPNAAASRQRAAAIRIMTNPSRFIRPLLPR